MTDAKLRIGTALFAATLLMSSGVVAAGTAKPNPWILAVAAADPMSGGMDSEDKMAPGMADDAMGGDMAKKPAPKPMKPGCCGMMGDKMGAKPAAASSAMPAEMATPGKSDRMQMAKRKTAHKPHAKSHAKANMPKEMAVPGKPDRMQMPDSN